MTVDIFHDSLFAMSLQLVSYAGVVGKECADAIAKHQAIQGNDTPAETTSPCVTLKAILSMAPPGLHLRKLPAPVQANQNAPTHLPQSLNIFPTFMML